MESFDPIQAAQERHQRRLAREQADVNDARLDELSDHAAETSRITRRERFVSAMKKVGSVLSTVGEILIAEQRNSPYTNNGYLHDSFVSTLIPAPLPDLQKRSVSGEVAVADSKI